MKPKPSTELEKIFEKFNLKEIFDYVELQRKKDKKVAPDDLEYWIMRTKELIQKRINQLKSQLKSLIQAKDDIYNKTFDSLKLCEKHNKELRQRIKELEKEIEIFDDFW